MIDNHGRMVNYLRLSVTDRCNLRCSYCMPESGIQYLPKQEVLSYEEMERLVRIVVAMGVTKIRITGGEPFLRRGLMAFLDRLSTLKALKQIHITTNGVLTAPHVADLRRMGIAGINLSLDTLSREKFKAITRRDQFDQVMEAFDLIVASGIPLKVNAVVMDGINSDQIIPLSKLAEKHPVEVRFIEEMPFNGGENGGNKLVWHQKEIFAELNRHFPTLRRLPDRPNTTAACYAIPGFRGTVGIIAGFSRLFCGSCNRMRITAKGTLKMCLYDRGVLDLKSLLRAGRDDAGIGDAIRACVDRRFADGFAAQDEALKNPAAYESMSEIGG